MISLLVLLLILAVLWAFLRIRRLGEQHDAIAEQLQLVESQLRELREKAVAAPASAPVPPPTPAPTTIAAAAAPPPVVATAVSAASAVPIAPPPLTRAVPIAISPRPVAPPVSPGLPPKPPAPPRQPALDWEQFMGAKLFAWLGGLAAFLGAAFFIKYSFEHDLIPPAVRATLGFAFAVALIIGGLAINRRRYAITAQTLCATGVVVLYAVTFASNAYYQFPFFTTTVTFALMSIITGIAFALAVRLDAKVVAILGLLGGFITPVLLSTGRDNPAGLFSYIALLDAGLVAVALHRRWFAHVTFAAGATVLMQLLWAARFLSAAKAPVAMIICLGFCALFLGMYFISRRVLGPGTAARSADAEHAGSPGTIVPSAITGSAIAFPFVAFAFAAMFIGYPTIAARPGLLFTYVLAADACLLAIAWFDERSPRLHLAAGIAVFALLAAWTAESLTLDLLGWALGFYLLYAVLHSAYPLWLERHRPAAAPSWWSQLFPPLALLLLVGPLLRLDPVPLGIWPCILIVDLLAIGLAMAAGSVAAVIAVLVLTLGVTGLWVFKATPADATGAGFVAVIGLFAVLFFGAGVLLSRKLGERGRDDGRLGAFLGGPRGQLPAFSALLPFLLLILITQRLRLENPSAVFGLALLLVVMTLALTRFLGGEPMPSAAAAKSPARVTGIDWLPLCALVGVAALEFAWRENQPRPAHPSLALAWFVGFAGVFAGFPFVFRRAFAALTGPWAVAALAMVAHFPLVYDLVRRTWPNSFMGLLPGAFAVPPLLGMFAVLRAPPVDARARLNQLAWFGGVALLFITLIFPIQFRRQWITIGWALEGAALLWLFRRVPHAGLRATGVVLLLLAFARLAVNPAVLQYHARSDTPLLNWYVYAYGVVTVCLFVGARLLARNAGSAGGATRGHTLGINAIAVLNTLGVVLAFLLLNVEIADFFSAPGSRVLTFEFSGNFARDMSFTIAWALFALALLLAGIWKRTRAGRYAALALLGVTLLKLFFHDLARLEALYRIGALFAVAVIAIVASVAYQRFLPADRDSAPPQ